MTEQLVEKFTEIVGVKNALTDADAMAPHLIEWRGTWTGRTPVVLKPRSTAEVAAILKLAQETRTAVVPQGGNTGLVGAQIPDGSGHQIVISTGRMNTVRALDTKGRTLIVDAGVTLQNARDAAENADLLFPLSLASQGTSQIGGNIASNAGGLGALAYGVARDLVLGLEVVLPGGRVLEDLSVLKKDNTGYALRHLFIGSEGTLGIITATSLKLFPKPKGHATMFAVLETPDAALELLNLAQSRAGNQLTAFELMADEVTSMAVKHVNGVRRPLEKSTGWTVLTEVSSLRSQDDSEAVMAEIAESALQNGIIADGAIAQSQSQRAEMWRLREALSEAQKPEGISIKHDISVPVHQIPAFIVEAGKAAAHIVPDMRFCTFGHMGDGNLHYNISQPPGVSADAFRVKSGDVTKAVHDVVRKMDGSISAEHGIGQMKRDELAATKSPVAMHLMRSIKSAF
ncbi:MAG: FAD-binding oxidoreductase, partial [Pseudomonadota bacterium]